MRQDRANKDYKANRFFVFDDRLELSDEDKYQLEGDYALRKPSPNI